MKSSPKRSASQIPNNLPPRPSPFVNRETEIQQAINALLDSQVSVAALVGIAGIGKTTLALEIAHRLLSRGDFTGGIIWLPARNLRSSDDIIGIVETTLGVSRAEIRAWLNSHQCLVVLDGLDEIDKQHESTVERFLIELLPSKVLVTSRKHLEVLSPTVVVEVGALDEKASVELFSLLWGQQRELSSAERQTAAEIARALGNHPLAITIAAGLVRGDYAETRNLALQASDILGELENKQERAALLHTLASSAQAQGDYSGAELLYQQSLEVEEQLGDLQGKSATLNNLAQIYFTRGDLDRALALYFESLEIKERLGDLQGKSATLNNLAQIYFTRGDLDRALALYFESLEIKERLGDLQGKSATLNNLAQVYFARGDLDGALRLYQESLALTERLGDIRGKSAALNNLAQVYFARGDLAGALRLYQESLALTERLGDIRGKAAVLHNLAQIYSTRGDLAGALHLYQESLALTERLGDIRGKAAVLHNLAQIHFARGDLDGALRLYQESLVLLEQIGLPQELERVKNARALVLNELGKQYVEQGRWYDALHLFEENLAIYRQGNDLDARADTIYQIARVHHLLGNLDKARTHYRDALRLYEHTQNQSGIATCKTGLGRLMIQMGFLEDAIRELEAAKQICQQMGANQRMAEIEEVLQIANHVKEKQRI
jgi:tetratricopeptide (TPR) repeat protein